MGRSIILEKNNGTGKIKIKLFIFQEILSFER